MLSTIDGYRAAIADKLGISPINISKDENLAHLLNSFHRDRPKGRRGIPSWNLSLVLHQLTIAPYVPSEHCATIWTGPQAEQGTSLCLLKKVFDKEISPATISSWIKQTVILCYELSDQEALTLNQVKAHDVRAFAASKGFQLGNP